MFAALIEIEVSGEDIYSTSVGTLLDGDLVLASNVDFNRIRNRSDFVLINRVGGGQLEGLLEGTGDYVNGRFHFQTLDDGTAITDVASIAVADIRSASVRIRTQAVRTRLGNLVTGDRLIVAFTSPTEPQTGSGEFGGVAASGVEGAGRSIELVVVTGVWRVRWGCQRLALRALDGRFVDSVTQTLDLGVVSARQWTGSLLIDPQSD